MKLQQICLLFTANLASVIVISDMTPAQAALINFDFSSTSSSGVRGRIIFDNSVTVPGQRPSQPTVARYLGAIQSYEITDGTSTFNGEGTFNLNDIGVFDNIIDTSDPLNRIYAGDGLEFSIRDGGIFLFLRFLYSDTTVLNSLALTDISLQNVITSSVPRLPLGSGGRLFTLLQVSNFGEVIIEDGNFFDSDFVTSTVPVSVPEPKFRALTILSTATALGFGTKFKHKLFKAKKE